MFKLLMAIFLTFLSSVFGLSKMKDLKVNNQESPTQVIVSIAPSPSPVITQANVPLPTGQDIVRVFFELINEKRIPEAISMMSSKAVPDDTHKQGYGVTFNQFKEIKVINIKESMKEEWTSDRQTYMVNLDVMIRSDSNQPILWDDGENTRFVTLAKENNLWKIDGIATGP